MPMRILMIMFVGMLLTGCSGTPKPSTYIDRSGSETVIRTDRDQCVRSCNDEYTRCMETGAAEHVGVHGPAGMFGASADCRNTLKDCLPDCKAR